MPRKPRLPPEITRVEGLSDGRDLTKPSVIVDDFTGERIAVPIESRSGPLRSGWELQEQAQRAKHAAQRAMLMQTGIIPRVKPRPKMVAPKVEGMRAVGQIRLKDGTALAMLVPKSPLRRI